MFNNIEREQQKQLSMHMSSIAERFNHQWIFDASKNGQVFVTFVAFDFLSFFRRSSHVLDARVARHQWVIIVDALKQRKLFEARTHPLMQIQYVGARVNQPADTQQIRVFGQELLVDDSPFVFRFLEMWIRI